ncbi:iron-containing alcohol dehydrogenase [Acetobacterium carbinolicum]|jgi:alcohol dehydrogenase|uniref:iron-containing alcohol dehydrogenase n=1 Tax=Acetobacterium TaxID=33951 RepID=UPI000DBEB44E|nr:iron-containing alcohol dehydrogenase [Acetobacterium sp. KB-1]AWW26446.1 lactaldehyde reductase [Acetobacterium sp. KB-1]
MAKTYYFPPVVIMGPGAIELITPEIKRLNVKKALVVTDKVLVEAGIVKDVLDVLDGAKVPYTVFSEVRPNPTVANVNAGLLVLQDNECDFVVSVGGGSPQDTAKGIAILATNPGDLRDYEGVGKTANKSLPIVAINTTAGTASEATINYVITDEARKLKMVIVDPNCLATVAVNDPVLMLKMPKSLTAATGMDALTHAIEGYTTAGASRFTDLFNLEAIKAISGSLRQAVEDGDDLDARDVMAYGQFVTGLGFSNAGLGIVHSMAHQLGGFYDLPHGVCNAILLPYVTAFNADAVGDRLKDVAQAMGVDTSRREPKEINIMAIDAIKKLSKDVGIPTGLKEIGVKEEDFGELADLALADICTGGNPKCPTKEDVISIYKAAF